MNQPTKRKQNYSIYQSEKIHSLKHKRPKSSLPQQNFTQQPKRSFSKSKKKNNSFLASDIVSVSEEALKSNLMSNKKFKAG